MTLGILTDPKLPGHVLLYRVMAMPGERNSRF